MPNSAFLSRLRRAIIEELEPEIELALKYALYQAAGHKRSEIARHLPHATAAALRVAEDRVRRAAHRLDPGDRDPQHLQ